MLIVGDCDRLACENAVSNAFGIRIALDAECSSTVIKVSLALLSQAAREIAILIWESAVSPLSASGEIACY